MTIMQISAASGTVTTIEADAPVFPADTSVPREVTKLQIRDQAVAMEGDYPGLWAGMKAFIEGDPERAERWLLAVGVTTTDPILDDLQAELSWSDAQRAAFLIAAGAR